ncbi:MAG: hypothetical protein QOF61_91, partial [Acidobacteriota bacterium]|nr:hypothetical protein [Acidobacteriota bacterium]
MRRTSIFTASIVVVVLLGHATGARRAASNAQDNAAARQQLPAATRADVPQEVAPQGSQTDLSGTYHGVVTVVSTGETVPAVLKIEDGKFTLRLGDRETTGTIKPADGRDNSVVEMTFDDGSPFGADWACILRVSKVGSRLSLLAEPGARGGFSFQTGVSGERRPASADSNTANTSTSNVTTNRSANTSANTSAVSNMNRATRDSNSSGTRGEFPSTIFRNRNRPSVPRPTPESVFMSMPDLPTTMSAPPPRVTAPAHTPVPANASMPLPMSSTSPPPASNASASGLLPSTVRDIVEHLPGGELALDAPAKMLQGVPRIFTARVSFGDIGSQITEGMPSSAT